MEVLTETGWAATIISAETALVGDVTCDVAVIGGGVGGMTAALSLAESGANVALVEAETCGWGASSRNAGYVTNSIAADPALLALLFRRSKVHALFKFAEAAVNFTEHTIANRAIDCDFEKAGIVQAAVTRGQLRKSRRNAEIMAAAGSSAEFVEGREAGLPEGFLGGMREGVGGVLNPNKYAQGLRSVVIASGAGIFEHSRVQEITDDAAGVTITTAAGRVRAKQALLTTNAYSKDFTITPRRLVSPVWTSLVETEPIAPERLDAIGWTSRAPMVTSHMILESYRVTPWNTIVFGTRRLETTTGPLLARTPSTRVVEDLVRGFRERFLGLSDVGLQRTWGGWIGMSSTWLPVAGQASPNVLYSLACNGHGFAQAQYVGHLLAGRLSGAPMPEDLKTIWHNGNYWPSFVSAPALTLGWLGDRVLDRLARV